MRYLSFLLCAVAWLMAPFAGAQIQPEPAVMAERPVVLLLRIDGAIGPATADYVQRGLQRAAQRKAGLVVLQLDTPGGLDTAMRSIIKAILASPVVVATAGASIEPLDPEGRTRLLAVVSEPSLALMLLVIGFYGLLFEFTSPGYVLPGVVGGVCLSLALFGLQTLPINYAGLALLVLGLAFFVAEAFVPSYGALGLGGVVAFTFGAVMLIDSDAPGFGVPRALVAALAFTSLAFVLLLAMLAARTRKRPVVSGVHTLVGVDAEVCEVAASGGVDGWARLQGTYWRVRGAQPLRLGERVRVKRVDGLTLEVEGE